MSIRNAAAVTALAAAALGAGATVASAHQADGSAQNSPGVAAGNVVQVAPRVSPNVGGNAISVIGVGNLSQGNTLINK
ncbi:chaplin [Streptosporangium nondiastaticum]|uniref:Chaplin n=1 Tax=Streptosporangium nondiastaticum TaxID=35764 RepID=A0A9X7PIZ0_9ACTN|nr:chaplin [Streptosporangium nondiastaticum]PSJ29694.1 chaplin [Streptosporangium nondiastaticum]